MNYFVSVVLLLLLLISCDGSRQMDPDLVKDKSRIKETLVNAKITIAEHNLTDFYSFTNQLASTFGAETFTSHTGVPFVFCTNMEYWNGQIKPKHGDSDKEAIWFINDKDQKVSIKFNYRISVRPND